MHGLRKIVLLTVASTFCLFACSVLPTVGLTYSDRHLLTQQLWDLAVRELTPAGMIIPPDTYEAERPKVPEPSAASSTAPASALPTSTVAARHEHRHAEIASGPPDVQLRSSL